MKRAEPDRPEMSFASAAALREALLKFSADHDFEGEEWVAVQLKKELVPGDVAIGEDRILFRGCVYLAKTNEVSLFVADANEFRDVRFQIGGSNAHGIRSVKIVRGTFAK